MKLCVHVSACARARFLFVLPLFIVYCSCYFLLMFEALIRQKKTWMGGEMVKKILNGGGGLSVELIKGATRIFPNAKLLSAYGMFSLQPSCFCSFLSRWIMVDVLFAHIFSSSFFLKNLDPWAVLKDLRPVQIFSSYLSTHH